MDYDIYPFVHIVIDDVHFLLLIIQNRMLVISITLDSN